MFLFDRTSVCVPGHSKLIYTCVQNKMSIIITGNIYLRKMFNNLNCLKIIYTNIFYTYMVISYLAMQVTFNKM